jgi:hypothetical protein
MNPRCPYPCCKTQFVVIFGMTIFETARTVVLGLLIAIPLARFMARR